MAFLLDVVTIVCHSHHPFLDKSWKKILQISYIWPVISQIRPLTSYIFSLILYMPQHVVPFFIKLKKYIKGFYIIVTISKNACATKQHSGGFFLQTSLLYTASVHIVMRGDYVHSMIPICYNDAYVNTQNINDFHLKNPNYKLYSPGIEYGVRDFKNGTQRLQHYEIPIVQSSLQIINDLNIPLG